MERTFVHAEVFSSPGVGIIAEFSSCPALHSSNASTFLVSWALRL
jgi:hypothetical protein